MADAEAKIAIDVDVSNALAGIRNLQKEIARFNLEMAKGTASQRAQAANLQRDLINNINASGKFAASIKTVSTSAESFTNALEKNKLSMGQYFRYAAGTTKTFGRLFSNEFNTIEKVARERVKTLQTQYIKLGRDANGAMKSIAIRPLALDMDNLATKTAVAAQKQAILNQLLKQGSTNLLNFGKNTQWAGRQLMVGFTIPLTIFGAQAAKSFMELEKQAIKFKRVYGDTFTATAETDRMIDQVKELASEFTKYGVQVEKTMEMAADAAAMGLMGADLLAQINQSTKLAVLGGVEQEKALETTISLTNAFGIAAEDLAGKIDFLNAVENQTVTAIEDLTIAIPKAAPVIKQLGGTVEDLAFFLTAMKEGGINASEGANALKSGLASLINPAEKTKKFLGELGINIDAIVEGNAGNVKNLVIEFAQALDTLDPLNRARAIEQLFGKFQFSRISTLFQNVVKEGTQAQRVLQLTRSTAAELRVLTQRELKRVEDSPMFKFQKAIEDLKVSLAPLGEAFIKAVTPLIKFGTDLLNNFNKLDDGTKNFIVTLGGLLGVVGPVALMTFGLLANGVANLIKLFVTMGGLFSKSKMGTKDLATSTQYLTQEQLEADAVAASLNSKHIALTNTFTSEVGAINNLVAAYNRALAAQGRLLGTSAARGRLTGPTGSALKLARGIESVPGPKGAGDIVPAMLSPGEAVIPARQSQKYGSIISAIMNDKVPGFKFGRLGGAEVKTGFNKGIVPKSSGWSFIEGLVRTLTGSRGVYGKSTTAYENKYLLKELRRPGKQVAVRMFSDDLIGSLGRGDRRYKNIFEIGGASRGSLDEATATGQRAIAEKQMFKLSESANPRQRPAYGYIFNRDLPQVNYEKVGIADRLFNKGQRDINDRRFSAYSSITQATSLMNDKTYRYGDIAMVLKRRALRGRTTQTIGDSINSRMNEYATPVPFGTRSDRKLAASESTGSRSREFIEAQILGGFSYKDIKRIVATEPQTIIALQTALKAAGLGGIRVGMPKLTMMQKVRSALRLGPSYPTKLPRLQPEGPYMGKYRNDPIMLNGRPLWLNSGIVSVPGPKGAGDVIPAMLSPGEAVIPTKMAQKYAPIINQMIAGKIPGFEDGRMSRMWFDPKNTLQASHLAPESELLSKANAKKMLQAEVQKALRLGIIGESDVNREAIKSIDGPRKLFAQQLGFLPSGMNQATASRGAGSVSASELSSFIRKNPGLVGAGLVPNLDLLKGTSMGQKYGSVTDTTLVKYLKDLDKNLVTEIKKLGAKTLSEKQQYEVFKRARIAAEKQITDISQRSAIKLANRFGDLRLTTGIPGSQSGKVGTSEGRTMKEFGVKAKQLDAQKRLRSARSSVFGLMGTKDTFLSQGNMMISAAMKAQIQPMLAALTPEARAMAERDLIAAKGDPKKLQQVVNKIVAGKYGKGAAAEKQVKSEKRAAATKAPAKTTTKAKGPKTKPDKTPAASSRRAPKPTNAIISRENLGNGASRTISQTPAGRVITRYFVDGKPANENKALERAQLKSKSSGLKARRVPSIGTAAATAGGAAMSAGMMMSFSGDEGMGQAGQNLLIGGMAISMLPMLANPYVAAIAAVAALGGAVFYLNSKLDETRRKAIETADAMSMTADKLTSISEFTGTVSATDIRKANQEELLTAQGASNRQFGQTFMESEAGQSMMKDIQTQLTNGIGRGQAAQNIGVQLSEAISQGILSVPEARSIAAAIGAQLNDYGFALRASATITQLVGPNGEDLINEPLQVALKIQDRSMQEFQNFADMDLVSYGDVFDTDEAKEFRNEVQGIANLVSVGALAAGAMAAPFTGGIAIGIGTAIAGISQLIGQTVVGVDTWFRQTDANIEMQGLVIAKGAEQLALQQRQLDALRQNYDNQVAIKEEQLAGLEAQAASATTEEEKANTLEKIKALQTDIANLEARKESDSLALSRAGLRNFYEIAQVLEDAKDPNAILNKAVESKFEGDELMIESAKQALEKIDELDQSSFKVFLQLGLVSGDLSASAVERLVGIQGTSTTFQAKFDLLLSERGLADVNLITQLLDNTRVNDSVFESLFSSFSGSGEDYNDMLQALSVISNIESRYGVRVDLNTDGQEQMDAVVNTIQAVEEFPDRITKETFAKFKKLDPPLYDAIMSDWNRLTGTDNLLNKQLIIDAKAIGDWDAVQQYLIATGKMGEAIRNYGGPIVADRVADPGNFIDRTTERYRDEAAVSFLPDGGTNADSGVVVDDNSGDGGTRNTTLDNILNKLKQVRDAAINATGGIATLLDILGNGKTLADFVGFDQQLVFKGYGPEFIDFLNGLDKVDREKFITIKNGIVSVTDAGKALNKAFAEAALGDFQFSLVQGISNMNYAFTAMNRLTGAGLSNADAFEIASNSALAYAIAIAATDEELQQIIDKLKILKGLQLTFDISTPEGLISTAGEAFSQVQEYFSNKKAMVDLDFEMGENRSGYNTDLFNMDALQATIDKAQLDIFNWETEIDDLEYLLDGIQKQEDDINEKYDKRVEALEKTNQLNKDALDIEKSKLSVADALTSGDVATAARAMLELREKEAERRFNMQKDALEAARDAELGSVTATNGQSRIQIEKEILDLKTQIAQKEEDILEPAEKSLTNAQYYRDVAKSMVENEDYLGNNEKEWRAIELAIKDTVFQTDEWKKKIIDIFKMIPGFNAILDENGNIIGFEFDLSELRNQIADLFKGIAEGVADGISAITDALTGGTKTDDKNKDDDGSGPSSVTPNVTRESDAIVGGTAGLINPGPVIADITPAEQEAIDIPVTANDLNRLMPNNPKLAPATPAETTKSKSVVAKVLDSKIPKGKGIAPVTAAEVEKTSNKNTKSGGGGKKLMALASGGSIKGPGTATSDSIPAMLSNGEYVIKASSVRKLGVDFLDFVNRNGNLPGFAFGGLVIPDKPSKPSKKTSNKTKPAQPSKIDVRAALAADKKNTSNVIATKPPTEKEKRDSLYKGGGFQGFEAGFQGLMEDISKIPVFKAIGDFVAQDNFVGQATRAVLGTLSIPVEAMGSIANTMIDSYAKVGRGDFLGAVQNSLTVLPRAVIEGTLSAYSGVANASDQQSSMFEKAAQSAIDNNFFGAKDNPEMAALARIIGGSLNVLGDPLSYVGVGLATKGVKVATTAAKGGRFAGKTKVIPPSVERRLSSEIRNSTTELDHDLINSVYQLPKGSKGLKGPFAFEGPLQDLNKFREDGIRVINPTPQGLIETAISDNPLSLRNRPLQQMLDNFENGKIGPAENRLLDEMQASIYVDDAGKLIQSPSEIGGLTLVMRALAGDKAAKNVLKQKTKGLHEHVSNGFLQRRINDIDWERAGVVPANPDTVPVIHSTKYPIVRDSSGNIVLRPGGQYVPEHPRPSLHFTIGAPVQSHFYGEWGPTNRKIVTSLQGMIDSNGLPHNLKTIDTWWMRGPGEDLVIPNASIITPYDDAAQYSAELVRRGLISNGDVPPLVAVDELAKEVLHLVKPEYSDMDRNNILSLMGRDPDFFNIPEGQELQKINDIALTEAKRLAGVDTAVRHMESGGDRLTDSYEETIRALGQKLRVPEQMHTGTAEASMESPVIGGLGSVQIPKNRPLSFGRLESLASLRWLAFRGFFREVSDVIPRWIDDAPEAASGGLISNGKLIKPKYFNAGGLAMGTDTIPSMLSPGEFVMSRYAVQNYGVDKMKAMNSGTYTDGSVYNYNLSVNVKSNSDPDEIARTVMTQIRRIDSQKLRSNRF